MKKYYFYGKEVSEYGIQNGYVDYCTLAQTFDAVLCNSLPDLFWKYSGFEPELVNGSDYDEENGYFYDIFQYYIIGDYGKEILSRYTNEIVYYMPEMDCYVWGVTHYGTSWDYVLTDISLNNCYRREN